MNLLLIPPDTRPPTLDFPATLARAAGITVFVPPPEALPALNQPGNFSALKAWLIDHAAVADALIVSLETLCLGGMIPARRVGDTLEGARTKLELLRDLKKRHPRLRLLAGGVIVRVAHDNDPFEEKSYYGEHGTQLRRYSEAFDRADRYPSPEGEIALARIREALPQSVLEDWLATRWRNHALHLAALELASQGVLEHLCLTLDDTSEYGLASFDRRALEARADTLGVWGQLDIYPGADEVPTTLVARALQRMPTTVYVRYAGTAGASARLLYEDRCAGELVKAHLRAAGALQVDTLAEAELVLAVNTPGSAQAGSQPDYGTVDTAERHLPEFVDFIKRCLSQGRRVSVADIAYPNGAELRLMQLLETLPLAELAGFAAWNTAGNSLGSAIAQGLISGRVLHRERWAEACFGRLVDDYLYQGRVREEVRRALGEPDPFDLGPRTAEAERQLAERLEPLAHGLWQRHFAATGLNLIWQEPRLAWPRLFTGVFPFEVHER